MDPVTFGIIGSLVSAGSGAIGAWLAGSADDEERRQRLLALREYTTIAPPEHRELVAREVARSRMNDVRRNAGLEAAQDEALAGYLDVVRDGRSARGDADYEQAAMDSAQLERSARESALASAAARGMGPEAAFTDLLLAGQAGADRERMAGLQRAAYNEEARMGALGAAGSMAAQRSATQWNQDAEQAQAQDEMDMFNAGQWNDMQRYNDQGRYRAFDTQLARADRVYGARNDVADMHARRSQRTREAAAGVGTGLGRAITAPGVYGPSGGAPQPAASAYRPTNYGDVGASAALQPALEQQRQIQAGQPPSPTRRRAR